MNLYSIIHNSHWQYLKQTNIKSKCRYDFNQTQVTTIRLFTDYSSNSRYNSTHATTLHTALKKMSQSQLQITVGLQMSQKKLAPKNRHYEADLISNWKIHLMTTSY